MKYVQHNCNIWLYKDIMADLMLFPPWLQAEKAEGQYITYLPT